ncbi:DNA-binding transcriptional MerR regulator [Actinoplanes tereljensis]|uniref:MerR family transcriptional regulator n=1 Tax=Paractinoplanes tereljensis TaxID=571912 RepID=A0A919NXM9_9ACTN|nr:MerR family transcriptional regulator [Actinoplanes tereljensis]GIF26648.1 MerR family transcriptional regulator [Actinoplanes tereljensis]
MRIKELAELTGATVRTIRHYHQIGLLPVPPTRDGVRDYGLVHVARMVRIRWLALAGVPLATIGAMAESTVLTDLRSGVEALDEQLRELQTQRDRMQRLIEAVERDGNLSPMPAAIVAFYDRIESEAPDERTRRVIRRERDYMELAFYRGDMPPEAAVLYERLAGADLTESTEGFRVIAERTGPLDRAEMEQLAAYHLERLTRQLGEDFLPVVRAIDIEVARRAADLYVRLAAPNQRDLDRLLADALLTLIEKGQAQ